ncbi:hypothetical protein TanjilG_28372 [Lupinus angustifolius]|uniref:STAS domain-containing protein n=1 Tax=Lupinus angustifolius TaxID=3871 RepID=A0A4P1RIE8_LUPAN|nr:hypothetical protein TanjilG_28372 [Lupinus angustifolius]
MNVESVQRVSIPPPQPFFMSLKYNLKETFFPDDPFKHFNNQTPLKRLLLTLQYFFPIFQWAPHYTFNFLKSDIISGITIATLAIPQGISYAKLANLPPILGLYSSFIPPMVYAMMGSSKDLAVGTMAVGSLLMASMLASVVNPNQNPKLFLHLAFTATFFAGLFQALFGLFRLGLIVDFLSHAAIVGFMGGAATVVCLQQLKSILGLQHFTHHSDILSVMRSVFTQTHEWRWESAILGCCFILFLMATRYFIGELKKGLNPPSIRDLVFVSPYMTTAIKTGLITGIIGLAATVGRSFAIFKNYHIDGNKEMIAFGTMNIVGSFTSCYITSGPFSRTAVNYNAGCKTAASNIVMAVAVMLTLLFLTPLFYYTPLVVLASILVSAMLGLIDYEAAIHLWKIDKFDFLVCISSYIGVVFGSIEIGLVIAVGISVLRVLLFVARPKTFVQGNIPNSGVYRNVEQYPNANHIPGILILEIGAPIYFANASYLRERITRWINEEEDRIKAIGNSNTNLQYVIMDMTAVANIDTSGISMLEELNNIFGRRGLQLVLVNPRSEVMKKLNKAKFLDEIGHSWIYLTVEEAVGACNFFLDTCKPIHTKDESEGGSNV